METKKYLYTHITTRDIGDVVIHRYPNNLFIPFNFTIEKGYYDIMWFIKNIKV